MEEIDETNVDFDEPTSFLDHVYLGCTQRECKPNEIMIEECTKMFESRISAGATEKLPGWEKLTQKRLRGPTIWKDMLENALRDIAKWRKNQQSSDTKLQVLAGIIIISRKEEL